MIKENLHQEQEESFNEDLESENNEEDLINELKDKPKKRRVKNKIILIELIIILILGVVVYFQFSSFFDKKTKVENNYQVLQKVELELDSCRETISQGEGEFFRYDYCREFIKSFDN